MNKNAESKKQIKQISIAIITAVSLGISAFLCGCSEKQESSASAHPTGTDTPVPVMTSAPTASPVPVPAEPSDTPAPGNPIEFEEKILKINGRMNHVFILKVDIADSDTRIIPYLSFDRIFGFENLQSMAEATGAYAAVNAGFFFEYGRPSGLVVQNGEIISSGSGKFYSLIIENGSARFEIVKTVVTLNIGDIEINIDAYNQSPDGRLSAVFSREYGMTDRLGYYRRILTIENGVVTSSYRAESPVDIPDDGFVVMLDAQYSFLEDPVGKKAEINFEPSFSESAVAYECATMLVENGISMAEDTMPWVGNLNQYDPRTCAGILEDGRVGFVVIDGRQKDYSSGVTGRETADILIDLGFTDAYMLDGGGSSQMIIDGRTVNSPSSGPEGRPIAGGFMIIVD